MSALLRHEVEDRLGSGPTGKQDMKSHAFMAGMVGYDRPTTKERVHETCKRAGFAEFRLYLYVVWDGEREGLQQCVGNNSSPITMFAPVRRIAVYRSTL